MLPCIAHGHTARIPIPTLVSAKPNSSIHLRYLFMASSGDITTRLRQAVWRGSIPLELRLDKHDCRTYDDSEPYLVSATAAV